jgi:peptidoglycan-associated lipoprotein
MHQRHLGLLLVLLAIPGATACRPKPPVTVAPAPAPSPAPVAEAPAPPPETPAPPADPLAGDLASVNAYLASSGLLGDVGFDFDRATLSPEAQRRLDRNAAFLKDNPQFEVTIQGHCDERGTNDYNLALGERRAGAALAHLVAAGVDRSRLRTLSYGEEQPVCTSSDEACWSRNRRAHFAVTGRR